MSTPQSWDDQANGFDDDPDHGLRDPDTRAAWRELLLGVLPRAPARVADLGCGTGTLSLLLAEQGYAVDGLDFSPRMIARAQAKVGARASLRLGDAADPDLPAGEYDAVLSRHMLWALARPDVAVPRWGALLRPDGRLILVEGTWHTGAGLSAAEANRLVALVCDRVEVTQLPDPVLWGGPISDERYLVVGHRRADSPT